MKKVCFYTVLILVAVFVAIFLKNDIYTDDDIFQSFFYSKNMILQFFYADHGRIWSWFVMKFWAHLVPSFFHLHFQQNIFGQIIRGINFSIFFFLMVSFFYLGRKIKYSLLVLLFNIISIFSFLFLFDASIIINYNQHFGYLFNYILFLICWFFIFNSFIDDSLIEKNTKKRDIVIGVVLAFCGHFVNIPSFFIIFSLIFYYLFKERKHFSIELLKKIFNRFKYLLISFCLSLFVHFNLPGFTAIRQERLPEGNMIDFVLNNFMSYSYKMFKILFVDYFSINLIFILIVLLLITWFVIGKNEKKEKYIYIVFSIIFGTLFFQYSLILCGKTYYVSGQYWIHSNELIIFARLNFILCINILLGYIIKNLNKEKMKSLITIFMILFVFYTFPMVNVYKNIKFFNYKLKLQQIYVYKLQKLYRWQVLRNEEIIVPYEYLSQIGKPPVSWFFKAWVSNCALVYGIKMRPVYITYKRLLNDKEFYTTEELNNINFERLFDDDFVSSAKKPKYGY